MRCAAVARHAARRRSRCCLYVAKGLTEYELKHVYLAYSALLQHVRQLAGVAGAVSEIPESEVRRRVDLALQVA